MAVRDTSMIHKCMKTLSNGAILKMPLVSTLIFVGAAHADDTFTESPHTFTEESIEYTVDLRIGDSGKTMYATPSVKAGEKLTLRLAQGGGFTAHFTT